MRNDERYTSTAWIPRNGHDEISMTVRMRDRVDFCDIAPETSAAHGSPIGFEKLDKRRDAGRLLFLQGSPEVGDFVAAV